MGMQTLISYLISQACEVNERYINIILKKLLNLLKIMWVLFPIFHVLFKSIRTFSGRVH